MKEKKNPVEIEYLKLDFQSILKVTSSEYARPRVRNYLQPTAIGKLFPVEIEYVKLNVKGHLWKPRQTERKPNNEGNKELTK